MRINLSSRYAICARHLLPSYRSLTIKIVKRVRSPLYVKMVPFRQDGYCSFRKCETSIFFLILRSRFTRCIVDCQGLNIESVSILYRTNSLSGRISMLKTTLLFCELYRSINVETRRGVIKTRQF